MSLSCTLCKEPLSLYPTNREHYIPQVLIKEFRTLCIPSKYNWAVRKNEFYDQYSSSSDLLSVPLSKHKEWACVEVHEKCNIDASPMCRDLRHIIDNLDNKIDSSYFVRPLQYYAYLWCMSVNDLAFIISDKISTEKRLSAPSMLLYRPGFLDCGRIMIKKTNDLGFMHDFEYHTTYIGTERSLNAI